MSRPSRAREITPNAGLGDFTDLQLDVDSGVAVHFYLDSTPKFRPEAGQTDLDGIRAGRQQRSAVQPDLVRQRCPGLAGRFIGDGDIHTGQDSAGRIGYPPFNAASDALGECR